MKLVGNRATWPIPGEWNVGPARRPDAQPLGRDPAVTAPGKLKLAFVLSLVALTVLDRFGLRLSETFSVNPGFLALYGIVATMLLTGAARLNGVNAMLYIAAAVVALLSFLVNFNLDLRQLASLGSLMLLLVLYAPFMLSLRPTVGTPALWRWMLNAYIISVAILAVAGILQFYAQFALHAPWLFDYTPFIPLPIRGAGLYNTVNPVGSLIKSNGFFLREASGFSGALAFALIGEWSFKKRKLVMAVLALGILVSYSGSGPVLLAVALFFPLGLRTLGRLLACATVGAFAVLLLGEALNLSYTLNRVGEFQSTRSSAYCRFIAPAKLVAEQIDSEPWTALVGHGPGTTQKMSTVCETTYGKVLFEYGLLGAIAFSALVIAAVNRSSAPIRMRAALIVSWYLLGGNLLGPESLLLMYLISGMWPPDVAAKAIQPPADPLVPTSGVSKKLTSW